MTQPTIFAKRGVSPSVEPRFELPALHEYYQFLQGIEAGLKARSENRVFALDEVIKDLGLE